MSFEIRVDDLSGSAIELFLREHLDEMIAITPPGSAHAMDVDALRRPGITVWSAWEGDELLGCAALKELDAKSGEIKSMRTAKAHRSRGVATTLLDHVVSVARARGYDWLYLETGSFEAFQPARALYARHGFQKRGPFADYVDDPNSTFMERRLYSPR